MELALMEGSRKKPRVLQTRPKTTKDETEMRTTSDRQKVCKNDEINSRLFLSALISKNENLLLLLI